MRYTEGGCINPRAAGKIIKRWLQFASKRKSLEILRLFHKPEYLLMTIFSVYLIKIQSPNQLYKDQLSVTRVRFPYFLRLAFYSTS